MVGCKKSATSPGSGSSWIEATAHAPFAPRYGLCGTVFNGLMWVVGGASGPVTTYYSDVWDSSNGSSWTRASSGAPFGGRFGSQLLSYNNQLWLIGGNNSGAFKNDVWTSTDGANWTQVLAPTVSGTATQFSPREDFASLVYNNQMWVIGGYSNGNRNDIWNSTDGVTWNQVLPNGPASATHFSGRWGLSATVYNNAMWVLVGAQSTSPNVDPVTVYSDVWTSTTGTTWNRVSQANIFDSIYFSQASAFNGEIWLTGGFLAGWGARNIVDTTVDGINWTGAFGPFLYRFDHLSLTYNNALWVIAGCDNVCQSASGCAVTYLNDVWYTR